MSGLILAMTCSSCDSSCHAPMRGVPSEIRSLIRIGGLLGRGAGRSPRFAAAASTDTMSVESSASVAAYLRAFSSP